MITSLIASFTAPMDISTTPSSLLWILPLAVAGVIVYKAMKVKTIKPLPFIKETSLLFAFLVGLLIIVIAIIAAVDIFIVESNYIQ